ncbi:electron transfer flavoprotein subunit alpha/FixB family protein, partial [Porphyromonas endodontalis]
MNNLFVYLEIENGIVQEVSLELLTKGRALATRLGCQLEAVAISNCIKGIAEQVFPYGVDRLHTFESPNLQYYTTKPYGAIVTKLFDEEKPQIALLGATTLGRDLGPLVSSALHSGLTADCT